MTQLLCTPKNWCCIDDIGTNDCLCYRSGQGSAGYPVPAICTEVDLYCGLLLEHGRWEWQDVGGGRQAFTCVNKIVELYR